MTIKRFNSKLKEMSNGKYALYADHLEEVENLKNKIKKLKRKLQRAKTTDAWKHYFREQDKNYQGSNW
jgi:archaellum component FlaC